MCQSGALAATAAKLEQATSMGRQGSAEACKRGHLTKETSVLSDTVMEDCVSAFNNSNNDNDNNKYAQKQAWYNPDWQEQVVVDPKQTPVPINFTLFENPEAAIKLAASAAFLTFAGKLGATFPIFVGSPNISVTDNVTTWPTL